MGGTFTARLELAPHQRQKLTLHPQGRDTVDGGR
jgi:hypothetical protein